MRVLTVHKKIVLARCPDEGWSSPRDMIKKIKKLYWPFVQTRDGHHLAKKIKKYN